MKGHAFGNLFMAALEKMARSFLLMRLASWLAKFWASMAGCPITLDDTTMSVAEKTARLLMVSTQR